MPNMPSRDEVHALRERLSVIPSYSGEELGGKRLRQFGSTESDAYVILVNEQHRAVLVEALALLGGQMND